MRNAGYLTSNANAAWPFDEDDPSLDRAAARMFADGFATVYPWEKAESVVVRGLSVSGREVSFSVAKIGPDGSDLSAEEIRATVDPDLPYAIAKPDDSESASDCWSSFVLDSFQVLQNDGASFDGPFRLSPSAVFDRANRVTSFVLVNQDGSRSGRISGNVVMKAGYNMYVGSDLSQAGYMSADPVGGGKTGVVIAASPGLGMGRVPCPAKGDCEELKGNLRPDQQGDIVIEGDGCYEVIPVGSKWIDSDGNVHSTVRIVGKCTACCQCDDYVGIGDRLADQSRTVSGIYARVKADSALYNEYARRFNESLSVVSEDELVVRCVVMGQNVDVGASHSVNMARGASGISGSIDRAQGVVSIKNSSSADATIDVYAVMKPQSLVMANIVRPNKAGNDWTGVMTETVDCSGIVIDDSNDSNDFEDGVPAFFKSGIQLPSGSGVTISLYGARGRSQTPNASCRVDGFVTFSWAERRKGSGESDPPSYRTLTKKFSSYQETPK